MFGKKRASRPSYVDPIPRRGASAPDSNFIVQTARGKTPYIVRHGKLKKAQQSEIYGAVYLTEDEATQVMEQPHGTDLVAVIEKILSA